MKRFAALWLPHWPTDRWRRQASSGGTAEALSPLVLTLRGQGGWRLAAVDAAAAGEGLHPGMTLADARALVPELRTAESDPLADAKALARLAEWCCRYTPWAASDGEDGIRLDITGSAHLFGGEAALLADLLGRLDRLGIAAGGAVADTPAAAWGWARFGGGGVLPCGSEGWRLLGELPVAALRLPAEMIETLRRLGLRRIAEVAALPRGPLATRFGPRLLDRLDQLSGLRREPVSPRPPAVPWRVRLSFAEPIVRPEDLALATRRLIEEMCARLTAERGGARRLVLSVFRTDGSMQRLAVGTARGARDPAHLLRLFAEPLQQIDPGFGIEAMLLDAPRRDALGSSQLALREGTAEAAEHHLVELVDRLRNRFGARRVAWIAPFESHLPERAESRRDARPERAAAWTALPMRPLRLLPRPEPIEAVAPAPAEPPRSFRWRRVNHRVIRAEGPERILPEWWLRQGAEDSGRDYYRLQDVEGRRYWVYRDHAGEAGAAGGWYLHGLFA